MAQFWSLKKTHCAFPLIVCYVLLKIISQCYSGNCFLNRYVFRFLLNASREQACLKYLGRLFHCLGAAKLKDLSPKCFRLILGSCKKCSDEERRFLKGDLAISVFDRYSGNDPSKYLQARTEILQSHLALTGNQCSRLSRGEA